MRFLIILLQLNLIVVWPVKRRLLRDDSSYGGIATSAYVDIPTIVRETIKEIGHI